MTFTVVMITVDRSPRPNYLGSTLRSLHRGSVFDSLHLLHFGLVHSAKPSQALRASIAEELQGAIISQCEPEEPRTPTLNVATALGLGGSLDAGWVLFLEDDIAVCSRFLESTADWVEEYADPDCHLYALGARDKEIRRAWKRGESSWAYPVSKFHCTQAFVVRRETATQISDFLHEHPIHVKGERHSTACYDLHIKDWHRRRHPGVEYMMATVPNFVQHIGKESIIRPEDKRRIEFPAWPGEDWSYDRAD